VVASDENLLNSYNCGSRLPPPSVLNADTASENIHGMIINLSMVHPGSEFSLPWASQRLRLKGRHGIAKLGPPITGV